MALQLLGTFKDYDELRAVSAQEALVPEGSLMLLGVNLPEIPTSQSIANIEAELQKQGVPKWPGRSIHLDFDARACVLYVQWVKGVEWLGLIIGILLIMLPSILGGFLSWLVPDSLLNILVLVGLIMVMTSIMGKM